MESSTGKKGKQKITINRSATKNKTHTAHKKGANERKKINLKSSLLMLCAFILMNARCLKKIFFRVSSPIASSCVYFSATHFSSSSWLPLHFSYSLCALFLSFVCIWVHENALNFRLFLFFSAVGAATLYSMVWFCYGFWINLTSCPSFGGEKKIDWTSKSFAQILNLGNCECTWILFNHKINWFCTENQFF